MNQPLRWCPATTTEGEPMTTLLTHRTAGRFIPTATDARRVLLTLPAFMTALLLLIMPAMVSAYEAPTLANVAGTRMDQLLAGTRLTNVRGNGDVNRGEVIGILNAPANELAVIIREYENIPLWSEALVVANVISRTGNVQIVEGETALPWPLTNRTWRIRSECSDRNVQGSDVWVNMWTHEPGYGNINNTYGYWMVYPLASDPARSIVKYVVNADPALALPDFVLNWVTNRVLPDLLDGLQARHETLY